MSITTIAIVTRAGQPAQTDTIGKLCMCVRATFALAVTLSGRDRQTVISMIVTVYVFPYGRARCRGIPTREEHRHVHLLSSLARRDCIIDLPA